ncbi:MAG: hypothetical protein MUF60_05315 [Vicinamibacterales bacterium]|nr:hypothetical protein [Vicinamibacterales bacterium]
MIPRERVLAALGGDAVDRPPVSFWGHVYHRESTAEDLVASTLERWNEYAWDWVKLNPRKHYHVEPWGVRYTYSGVPDDKTVLTEWPIHAPDDWRDIHIRTHDQGALGEQIEAVRMLRRRLPTEIPLIQTVFTPLAILGEMTRTPGDLRAHIASHPDLVIAALDAVTETFVPFVHDLLRAGADGIYFATVDWASREQLGAGAYAEWARPWDLRLMAAAVGAPFNVLHVCRRENLLLELADYPVHAFSWAATEPSNPTLAEALTRLPGAVMGGVAHDGALLAPDPAGAIAELRRAHDMTGGRRWLAAPGCSIPPAVPAANLRAVRQAVLELAPAPETTR